MKALKWIICKSYTPKGVVVVVDVVPTKVATEELVVDKGVLVFLLNIIIPKIVFFVYQKNNNAIFMNITILDETIF